MPQSVLYVARILRALVVRNQLLRNKHMVEIVLRCINENRDILHASPDIMTQVSFLKREQADVANGQTASHSSLVLQV